MPEVVEVEIVRLGHRGDGVAEPSIFAAHTLPGEIVRGELNENRLTKSKVLEPSTERVTPICSHFGVCGGCQLQHGSDEFVASWKTKLIEDALAARGLRAEILPIATSPIRSRRRATFAVRRTKKGVLAGFHAQASETIVAVPDCPVLTDGMLRALPFAEALAPEAASRKGTLSVAVTESENGLDVTISGGKPLHGPLRIVLSELAARYDLARLSYDEETIVTRRKPVQSFDGISVCPPPGSFLQATRHAETTLQNAVCDLLADRTHIVDLFAGCGTFAFPLSKSHKVQAFEGDESMVDAMRAAWRMTSGLKSLTSEARDLFRNPVSASELQQFDAAVVDPPRAGAAAQVAEFAKSGLSCIAYVSCNPASFARDARTLVDAGYELESVLPVDQFRWSAHVELVASFKK